MKKSRLPRIARQDIASLGWRTALDQQKLYAQRLLIAGVGGAGGGVAEAASREGMHLTLIDPDQFDATNINRQTAAYRDTVGQNKARAVAQLIKKVRGTRSGIRVFEDGLSVDNMDRVLDGATIVLDAIDISRPDLSIALSRKARDKGIPVFMGIEVGYGCAITMFHHRASRHQQTAEHYYGVGKNQPLEEYKVPLSRILTHVPSYMPNGMLEAFSEGKLPNTPSVSPGVQILSGVMMTAITRWVLGNVNSFPQFVYPNIYVFDPIDGMFVIHADERMSHFRECTGKIGTNDLSSGYSLPKEYLIIDT